MIAMNTLNVSQNAITEAKITTLENQLAVMRAYKYGARIQCRPLHRSGDSKPHWIHSHDPQWFWDTHEYRVDPMNGTKQDMAEVQHQLEVLVAAKTGCAKVWNRMRGEDQWMETVFLNELRLRHFETHEFKLEPIRK